MAYTSYQYNASLPTKGAGMAPAVAAALVQGGTQLVGGALSGKGNKRAIQTQDAAARRAEAIAIDNEKRRREEYDRAEAANKAQWDAEQARLAPRRALQNGLLGSAAQRWGMDIGALGGARQAAAYPGSGATASPTLADLGGRTQPYQEQLTDIQAAPALTIADIANWGSKRRAS